MEEINMKTTTHFFKNADEFATAINWMIEKIEIDYIAESSDGGKNWDCYYPTDDTNYGIKDGKFLAKNLENFKGFFLEKSYAREGAYNVILLY
jgi:hypothetical protein